MGLAAVCLATLAYAKVVDFEAAGGKPDDR